MSNQKIIYKRDDKIILNVQELKKFYLPILFVLFFIQQSVYGQTLFNELGISSILAIIFFMIFIFKIKKTPKSIIIAYGILIFYTIIITYFGQDWKNWVISIFTLSSIGIFIEMKISKEQIKSGLFYTGIISNIILFIYNYGNLLSGWNSNTVGLLTTIGTLGLIISYKLQDNKIYKIINMILILFSLYMIILTENRNSLLVFVIAFISVVIIKEKMWKKNLIKLFLVVAVLLPMIIATMCNQINDIPILNKLSELSTKIFQKDTIFSGREEIWQEGERLIKGNYLFGTGESLYNYIYVHNMYYSVVYFFGIVGYILYIVFLFVVIQEALKGDSSLPKYCILIFISIILEQIAEITLFTADLNIFMPYIFLSIALNRQIENKKEKKNEKINSIYTNIQ